MRIVIADDSMLLREGLSRLLTEAGFEVVATVATADELLARIPSARPDVAIVDIKMPPTHTDEGIVAAQAIRRLHPTVGVLVLSHYLAPDYAMRLLEDVPDGAGYLLKERVSDIAVLADALHRIHDGECVVDPTIVSRLVKRQREHSPLESLTERERLVLTLMAEGRTNRAIGEQLFVSPKTVENHIGQIFQKLGFEPSATDHRRVLAVLVHLRADGSEGAT
jgi:DNA-binding NarL/FixJ family response regulator